MCYCGKPEMNLHGLSELVIVSKTLMIGFVVVSFLSHAQKQPVILVVTIIETLLCMMCPQMV